MPVWYLLRRAPRIKYLHRIGAVHVKKTMIWIHAVSAGEVIAAGRLLAILPECRVHITVMSGTGYAAAAQLAADNTRISYSYLPIDFYLFQKRFIKKLACKTLIVVEHDFWPAMLRIAGKLHIRRIAVNVCFKPRDTAVLKKISFYHPLVYNFDHFLVQNTEAASVAEQIRPLAGKIVVAGNIKYLPLTETPVIPDAVTKICRGKKIIVFGSSHNPEEQLAADAVFTKGAESDRLLILIPRHPERAKEIFTSLSKNYNVRLWSEIERDAVSFPENNTSQSTSINPLQIIIVDKMGISLVWYYAADIVLIGDTFRPSQGGHNFLEPCAFKKAVLYGTYMRSFSDITPMFEAARAVCRVSPESLSASIHGLLDNPAERERMGRAAEKLLKEISFNQNYFKAV